MNTINVNFLNSSQGRPTRNLNINKVKDKFPTLSPMAKSIRLGKLMKKTPISLHTKRMKTEGNANVSLSHHININPNIKMVRILNFEEKVDDILSGDLELQRQKEKIDKNKTIKLIRLGLYKRKEKEKDNSLEENPLTAAKPEKTDHNIDFFSIAEKEKENEEDLEKIDIENRDKEKKLENKLKEAYNSLEKIKENYLRLNAQINNINKIIEDLQIEESVLDNYGEEFKNKNQEKLSEDTNKSESREFYDSPKKRKKQQEIQHFEQLNKMIILKKQREEKKKLIQENILIKQSAKKKLENELNGQKDLLEQGKQELFLIRKKLINSYHLKLYEGLDFKGEGLISIIKDIWSLGINVNINFMPSYLDAGGIEFLFKKARQSIELNKMRQIIKENEIELASYLKDWKRSNNELHIIPHKNNPFGLNTSISNLGKNKTDDKKNNFNENELFKTKISDISISYLDPYPKTKQFMIEYKKKHPNLFQRDLPTVEIKHIPFKSANIPIRITEKNKYIEKLKYLLEMKIGLNKEKDKKEVERLNKEFIKNSYKEKYEANVETVFGALFGEEKKNEMLIYYSKLERNYREGKRIIQFHTKLNLKLK